MTRFPVIRDDVQVAWVVQLASGKYRAQELTQDTPRWLGQPAVNYATAEGHALKATAPSPPPDDDKA